VRSSDRVLRMATDKVTTFEGDGIGDGVDTQMDYITD
jgi:hypothetical protein